VAQDFGCLFHEEGAHAADAQTKVEQLAVVKEFLRERWPDLLKDAP
jgi:hypothetical protein